MSTLTLNRQGKLKKQANAQPYRRILDLQAKQKFYNNSRLRRLQTEPQFVTPHYSSSTQNITEKKLIQYSTFLPAISKKDKFNKLASKRQSYNQQYYQGNTTTIDTEYQAMQHINECQTIIQNLKKLTNYNKSRADKAQMRYLSPKRQTKMSHAYFNDINRSSPGVQRQPSFFRSSGENFEHPYSANKKNGKIIPLKKYEGIFEEGISKIQPPTSKRKQQANYEDFGQFDSRIKQQSQFSDEQNMESEQSRFKIKDPKKKQQSTYSGRGNHEDSLMSYSVQDPDTIANQHTSNFSLKQQLEEDEESQQNMEKDDQVERQRKQKEEQQLKNAKKRQSILLKFLMKAKSRGSELQKKIIDHKTKNNMSMIYSRRSKIANPEAKDYNRADVCQKFQQVEKEQQEDENENEDEDENNVDIQKQDDSKSGEQVQEKCKEINEDLILKMVEQNAE